MLVIPLAAAIIHNNHGVIEATVDDISDFFAYKHLKQNCSPSDPCRNDGAWKSVYGIFNNSEQDHAQNMVVLSTSPRIPFQIFRQFSALKSFQMVNQYVRSLQIYDFEGGNNLSLLNLTGNMIESFDFGLLADARALEVLDLSKNRISAISNVNSTVLELKELYLNHNKLVEFESYGVLSKIKVLFLNNNRLKRLNNDVIYCNTDKNLGMFKSFDVSNNPLIDFPSEEYCNSQVDSEILSLNSVRLTSLNVPGVTKILRANHNNISSVILDDSQINTNLRELYLRDNQLYMFPYCSNCNLSALLILDLSHNFLSGINGLDMEAMQSLRELRLTHNLFTSISYWRYETPMPNIHLIDLSYNFDLVDFDFGGLPRSTVHLGIANIGLSDIDENIKQDLPRLKSILSSGDNMNSSNFMNKILWLDTIGIKVNLTNGFNAVFELWKANDGGAV